MGEGRLGKPGSGGEIWGGENGLVCRSNFGREGKLMMPEANKRIFLIATFALLLDQITKEIVVRTLRYGGEYILIEDFFRLVHWGNTGAAWSLFRDNNVALLIVAIVALTILFLLRRHFGAETRLGQIALGLMFGGIVGNIIDRVRHDHVVDFLYFYVQRRSGQEIGFPAFNVADSAICVGVGLLFVLSWQADAAAAAALTEARPEEAAASEADSSRR